MRKTFNVAVDESEENLHWNDLKKAAVVKSQPKKQKNLTVNMFQKPSTNNEVVAKLTASRKSINTSSSNSSLNSSSKSNNLSASKTLLISSLKNKTSTSTTGKASSSTIFTPIPRNVSDMVADTYDDYDQVNTTTNSGVGFDVGSLRNSELFDDDADATYLSNTCETDDNVGQFRSTRNAIEMAVDDNQIITETVQSDDDEVDLDDDGDDLKWIRSIPKNYDDRDEILEIIKVSQLMGSKGKLWLNKILFNLICCIAGDNIAQTSQTDTIEYHEKLANEVIELEKNLNLRKQMNDHLLVHMKGKLPESLKPFMNNLSSKNASKSYVTKCLNKDKKMDVQKMKHNYFGSKVENIFKMSRSEINKINDRWIPSHKLKSGRNRAGLHKSIKDFCMNVYDIPQRAKKSADRRSKYLKKKRCGDENEDDDDEESDEEDDDETRGLDHMVEDIQSFNDKDKLRSVKENELISSTDANTYFPEWWLSFLILGMPNLIDYGTKNSFSSGIHVDKKRKRSETSNFQGASKLYGGDKSSSMETIPGKGARQRLHEFANLNKESSNTNNVEPLKEPIHKKIVREIQMAEVKKTKFEIDLELIDKEIELMIQLKESENEIDNLRREKLAIIKNQRRQNNN